MGKALQKGLVSGQASGTVRFQALSSGWFFAVLVAFSSVLLGRMLFWVGPLGGMVQGSGRGVVVVFFVVVSAMSISTVIVVRSARSWFSPAMQMQFCRHVLDVVNVVGERETDAEVFFREMHRSKSDVQGTR